VLSVFFTKFLTKPITYSLLTL